MLQQARKTYVFQVRNSPVGFSQPTKMNLKAKMISARKHFNYVALILQIKKNGNLHFSPNRKQNNIYFKDNTGH